MKRIVVAFALVLCIPSISTAEDLPFADIGLQPKQGRATVIDHFKAVRDAAMADFLIEAYDDEMDIASAEEAGKFEKLFTLKPYQIAESAKFEELFAPEQRKIAMDTLLAAKAE